MIDCKHLRRSTVGKKIVQLHCAIGQGKTSGKLDTVITEATCAGCPLRRPRDESIEPPKPQGEASLTRAKTDAQGTSLARLGDTLPPFREERDRRIHFEADGTIVYEREDERWEPPPEINGYERDANDDHTFHPLWPPCTLRHQMAVRFPACGCINVIMRCNNPRSQHFAARVSYVYCLNCEHRQEK
jgi:hypothetical protein